MRTLSLTPVSYEGLTDAVRALAEARRPGHIHTTPPGCLLTGRPERAILLESSDDGRVLAFFDHDPIEARAKPLAILLHGADSVPDDTETLAPACEAVIRMAERMTQGKGHFHILTPVCEANAHPGQWAIVFEDVELGLRESISAERPLADIRLVERLIYANAAG
jgi:hypothetical protein